jgi:hypothetical protein
MSVLTALLTGDQSPGRHSTVRQNLTYAKEAVFLSRFENLHPTIGWRTANLHRLAL